MATFPSILALDFSLIEHDGGVTQGPVLTPNFVFQHSSDFDPYRPGNFDFIFLDDPLRTYAVLHHDLASAIWESLKMKGHYILSACTIGMDRMQPFPFLPPFQTTNLSKST